MLAQDQNFVTLLGICSFYDDLMLNPPVARTTAGVNTTLSNIKRMKRKEIPTSSSSSDMSPLDPLLKAQKLSQMGLASAGNPFFF